MERAHVLSAAVIGLTLGMILVPGCHATSIPPAVPAHATEAGSAEPPADRDSQPASPAVTLQTVSVRTKPDASGDACVVVRLCVTADWRSDCRVARFRWQVQPAFESIFGLRDVARSDVVENGTGDIVRPETWTASDLPLPLTSEVFSDRQQIPGARGQDEQVSLDSWRKDYYQKIILRIRAADIAKADQFYTLNSSLELRNPNGTITTLHSSERVRFLHSPGNEAPMPADMRDPTGILPDDRARDILKQWLLMDDWYVQSVAVVRLKAMGYQFKPDELNRFFRLAALSGEKDRRLIFRALDSLTPGEGSDGVAKLLKVDCAWALPYALRFRSEGTVAYLHDCLRESFTGLREQEYFNAYNVSRLMDDLIAAEGAGAYPFLAEMARQTRKPYAFFEIASCLEKLAPEEALELARWNMKEKGGTENCVPRILARHGNEEDIVSVIEKMGYPVDESGRFDPDRRLGVEIHGQIPDRAVPMLLKWATGSNEAVRRKAIQLLAGVKTPEATALCLSVLGEGKMDLVISEALAVHNRTDVATAVIWIALEQRHAGGDVSGIWPMLLLTDSPDIYDLAWEYWVGPGGYSQYATGLYRYLLKHPTRTAENALGLIRSKDVHARDKGIGLLLAIGDGRAVPSLLERALQPRTTKVVKGQPDEESEYYPEFTQPWMPWNLTYDEMNYLAAFIEPRDLQKHAHLFAGFTSPERAEEDTAPDWYYRMNRHLAGKATVSVMDRIKGYLGSVGDDRSGYDGIHGPPPYTPVASPQRILMLRQFSVADILPLTESAEPNIRALGARLLGKPHAASGREYTPAIPVLEKMLFDPDDGVKLAAAQSLHSRAYLNTWGLERLIDSNLPEAWSWVAEGNWYYTTLNSRRTFEKKACALLLDGHSEAAAVLNWALEDKTQVVADILSSPRTMPEFAECLFERLSESQEGVALAGALKAWEAGPSAAVKAVVLDHLGELAGSLFSASWPPPPPQTAAAARKAVLEGLQSADESVRDAAVRALAHFTIPESIPFIVRRLDGKWRGGEEGTLCDVIQRQGCDERLLAAVHEHVTKNNGEGLILYAECAPREQSLPLLREFEAKRRLGLQPGGFNGVSREEVVRMLILLEDDETLSQQAESWLSNRGGYWTESLPLRPELKRHIARMLMHKLESANAEERINMAQSLCSYDLPAGFKALLSAINGDNPWRAETAKSRLGTVFGYGFGGPDDHGSSWGRGTGRVFSECARHAERWWQLEQGRPLEVLRGEALFP